MKDSRLVVTDSGGLHEDTTCLGVPCVTVRDNTERAITLERGTNAPAGTHRDGIKAAIRRPRESRPQPISLPGWDDEAARRVVETIIAVAHQGLRHASPSRLGLAF